MAGSVNMDEKEIREVAVSAVGMWATGFELDGRHFVGVRFRVLEPDGSNSMSPMYALPLDGMGDVIDNLRAATDAGIAERAWDDG